MKQLKDNVYYTGVLDAELEYFDVIFETEAGTSYNSYLVRGEKNAVIDSVKAGFSEEFLTKIENITPLESIDYIVMNHTEPDHSGSLKAFLEKAPNAKVVTSRFAANLLKEILNEDIECMIVGDGDVLDLGGKTLSFVSAPFLHWPDTQFTYLKEDKILFPCDLFGCHYGNKDYLDFKSGKDTLRHFQQVYLDGIMNPFKNYAIDGIEKIKDLDIEMIAPSHGPILTEDIDDTITWYKKWAEQSLKKNEPKVVYVHYVSCYGYTAMLAEKIGEGIESTGLKANVVDIGTLPIDHVVKAAEKADGLALGSPTINRDVLEPIWEVTLGLSPYTSRGKNAAVFGSFGWSGEACKYLEERLTNLGFQVVGSTKTKMFPNEEALRAAYDLGVNLGNAVKA
ncbi:hypothetical protein AZF37_06205 [endosymbiont 'TC1' of Trimyema compressum]|uniref:FprA family A-type flavoprotein n=1 Tax=endosymbiont 'TC1' of Trimyema compressum TaxID=243899 RepID=UPI0007F13FF3|nr:FprA family A-type flavoprotein [endosymbiont 'TC1' of Trimyema compressum]AMP20818.1 hypothetical protein AZF37_06205 [endosymbiont 'TC1' of Trimyema compressum]